jgi:hypothetical protein
LSNANSYFTFNALLEAHDINLKAVKYYCHTVLDRGQSSNYELFITDRDGFDEYQSIQGNKSLITRPYLASFVRTPMGEAVFTGFYAVKDVKKQEEDDKYKYELEKLDILSKYCGHLFVDFPKERAFCRCPENVECGLPIMQLSKPSQTLEFPGFHNFIWSISKLNTMPDTWQNTLKNMKGVYLLTCRNHHKLYVGSAYGENGFLGRWQNGYADGEGGGNKELINFLKSHPDADFHISILEIAASTDSVNKIIGNENSWKAKLNTRNLAGNGLNCN